MQDDDTHWYLVPLEEVELFKELFSCNDDEITREGHSLLEKRRVDGPHSVTFTNPLVG
jgi:hypothetical protein